MPKHTINPVKTRIRKATAGDVHRVVKLNDGISAATHKERQYRAELSNPLSHFYVAVDPVVGTIMGYTVFWVIDNLIEIHQISVGTTCQRSGIGRSLMEMILKMARQESVDRICLEVRRSNQAAIAFYEDLGFIQCGFRPDYYRNPVDDALVLNKTV